MLATIKAIHGCPNNQAKYLLEGYETYLQTDIDGTEKATCWLGQGALYLGLRGSVKENDFTNLLSGKSPVGETLVANFKDRVVTQPDGSQKEYRNTNSYDIPISLEKSFSIFAYTLSDHDRALFNECIKKAAKDVVHILENNLQLGRRGKGGHDKVHAKLVASLFLHLANRSAEPHIHAHLVINNVGLGADGRWSKLDSKAIHQATPMLGRVFRASFAREMIRTFGVELERPIDPHGKQHPTYVIKGIPRELCEAFSTARQKLLDEAGDAAKLKGKEAARLRTSAHLATRNEKDPTVTFNDIREKIYAKATELGIDATRFSKLFHSYDLPSRHEIDVAYKAALKSAIETLSSTRAHFSQQDIAKEVLDTLQDLGVDGSEICQRVFQDTATQQTLRHTTEKELEPRIATSEQTRDEQTLMELVQALQNRSGAVVSDGFLSRRSMDRAKLSPEQKFALNVALRGEGAIRSIYGEAGTGKSTVLKELRKQFEARGYSVSACAVAGVVAQDLEAKTGIPSRTVASRLLIPQRTPEQQRIDEVKHNARMLARSIAGRKTWSTEGKDLDSKSVLVVEEAGMLSAKDMLSIVSMVNKAKATLVLVGDSEQLPAIGAGSPFELITRNLKAHARLETNYRQYDPSDIQAIKAVRSGNIEEAIQNYRDRGKVVVSPSASETRERVVASWKQNGGMDKPAEHAILTQTRFDCDKINRLCQQSRIEDRGISPRRIAVLHETPFAPGDRVMFHQALRTHGIENGHTASVLRTNPSRHELTIKLERPLTAKQRSRGLKQVVTVRESDLSPGQLKLGYAATTHKLQGATVDHAYVLTGGPMTSRQMAYVQLSRARKETTIFVDQSLADDDFAELARLMTRDRKNQLAHEVGITHH